MGSWTLIGEDCEALYHPGHLPLDWRTKAKALLDGGDLGRYEASQSWSTATVRHEWEVWAPPGEHYGGTFVGWGDRSPQDGPEGWCNLGEHTWCPVDPADDSECAGRPDIVCLQLDKWDDAAVRAACETAPPEVHLVTAGEGWPWLCRIIGPVTVVTL